MANPLGFKMIPCTKIACTKLRRRHRTWALLAALVAVPCSATSAAQSPPATAAAPPASPAPPLPELPPDLPPAVRAYLEALQKRVQELEKKRDDRPPAAGSARTPPPPATPARPPPPQTGVKTLRGVRVEFGGYAEARITNVGNPAGDRTPDTALDFQIARFRPRLSFLLDQHWQADVQLNAATRGAGVASVNARDLFMEYHRSGYRLRLGQQKIPFGYEVFVQGDEERPALERSRVFGSLFPDERDLGFVAMTSPRSERAVRFALGVVNGNGINRSDNETAKSVAANVRIPLDRHNTLGLSGYAGTFSPVGRAGPGITFVRQAVDLDHQASYGRFRTQLEALLGRNLGHGTSGGYGQIEYRFGIPGSVFVRHDWFDPAHGPGEDYWSRTSLGWYRDFTANARITAEYDWVRNKLTRTGNDNTFGVEVQGRF